MRKIMILAMSISMCFMLFSQEKTFDERAGELLGYYEDNGSDVWLYGVFRQLAAYANEKPMLDEDFDDIFATIKSNHDCNDFTLNGLLRMMYLDRNRDRISRNVKKRAKECVLDFKYWWDDGRRDTTYRCYHTENHQALYHTAELLAGQLYKKDVFTNGMTGEKHMSHAVERLVPWLDYRFRFGFSEWHSTYSDVEALLLVNLIEFAEDKEIRRKAENVLNILMFDLALNQHHGYLAGSSGRTYASSLLTGKHTTMPLCYVALGVGDYKGKEITGAVAVATGSYRCPEVIRAIACDSLLSYDSKLRTSLNVEDASAYGIHYDRELDCHLFWGMQEFIHPLAIRMSKQISEKYDTWPYRDYDRYINIYEKEIKETGKAESRDRFALSEANVVTRRTPDYILSTTADYRKGRQGYQQLSWIAALSPETVVYTNHPGGQNLKQSPNYWAGTERLPRAAQHDNISICIYNIPENNKTQFTHAHFPVNGMDEIRQNGNWTFGRKDDGYIALYSSTMPSLKKDFRGEMCDLVAESPKNVWLCEMGSKGTWESFDRFVSEISNSNVESNGIDIEYESPSAGKINFGWDNPLKVNDEIKEMRHKYRYDNPFCKAELDTKEIIISHKGKSLKMTL